MTKDENMKKHTVGITFYAFVLLCAAVLTGCAGTAPLASWNDGAPAKTALTDYVAAVTKKDSPDFIPPARRIAVFDLDGTLFLETDPTYFDWLLFEYRVLDDPACKATREQTAAAEASRKGRFPKLDTNRERMVSRAYQGMTLKEFDAFVKKFKTQDQPGFVGLKRGDAFYKPMLEVIDYLVRNGFTVYVVSGTDRLTVRALAGGTLDLPPHQIIGSDSSIVSSGQNGNDALAYTFKRGDTLVLGGKNLVKTLQMNKVSAIVREIGVQPVLAFGNALSDASMLNYTISGNRYRALGFMLLCDDLEREYGNAAKADKMRRDCRENGWIPVSMRDDWKTIYGKNVTKRKPAARGKVKK